MSSRGCRCGSSVEMAVDLAGEVALERASDLAKGAPLGGALFDVGACVGVHAHPGDYGHVEGAVEASVATSIDSVAHGVPGRRGDWVDAGQAGERSFGADASGVRPRGESDGCGDWSDAGLVEQAGRGTLLDQGGHLVSDCRQLVVRSAYPHGQSDGLGPGDAGCEFFGATAPAAIVAIWPPLSVLRASTPRPREVGLSAH